MAKRLLSLLAILWLAACGQVASLPGYMDMGSRKAVSAWLSEHSDYRVATDADCHCDDDLVRSRTGAQGWKAEPNYHPYYIRNDFNDDGTPDTAVGVVRRDAPGAFSVLILDGATPHRAFLSGPVPFPQALFTGPQRSGPTRLGVGPFESEACLFVPKKDGIYGVDCSDLEAG